MDLGQVVEPLIVRHYALQCPITGIAIRLATMEAGHRPRSDTMSSTTGTTTMPHALSHSAQVRSSAIISRWISSLVFGSFSTVRTMHRLGSRTNCRLSIYGVPEDKSQGSSVATTVARLLPPRFPHGLEGGVDQFGDRLPIQPLKRWPDPSVGARPGHVIAPQPTGRSCVGNNGETQLKRALTQGVGIVSNLSRSKRGGGLACSRCGAAMDEVVRIAPLPGEPGLIAYECPGCGYVTSLFSVTPTGEPTSRVGAAHF